MIVKGLWAKVCLGVVLKNQSSLRLQAFFANCFLVIVSLVVAFAVAEFTARWVFDFKALKGWDQVNDEIHRPRPFVEAVASTTLPSINSLGYKGPLPEMPKPKGEFRIAILGGSTVFGHEPGHEMSRGIKSLPGYLNDEMQKMYGDHIRVYNFGITSTIAQQELARVVMDVVSFEPDLVISYGGGNDFFSYTEVGYPHRYLFHEVNPLWITKLSEYPAFHLFAFGSVLVRRFFRQYFEDFFYNFFPRESYTTDRVPFYHNRVENYTESLRRMEVISNAFGAQFIGYFQPLKYFYFQEENNAAGAALEFLKQVLKSVQLKNVRNYKSLKAVFENDPKSIWQDEIHIYDEANKKMARYLAKDLESLVLGKGQ